MSQTEATSIADRDFVLLLISLYRDRPELWQVKSKDYLNKRQRRIAFDKILSVLKIYKPDYDEEQLKKKINVLRTNFNKEYQKVKKRSDASSDVITEPTLWYYNDLLFIKDQVEETPAIETSEEIPSPPPSPIKIKKQTSYSKKQGEDETEIIAKYWAIKLKRLAADQRCYAEKIISDVLFEGEMGTLTRHDIHFQQNPLPSESQTPPKPSCSKKDIENWDSD